VESPWSEFIEEARRQVATYDIDSKLAVYSVIFSDYDVLRGPYCYRLKCDFYCITDSLLPLPRPWRAIRISHGQGDVSRANRLFKFFPHLFLDGYARSVYLDGNIAAIRDPAILADRLLADQAILCLSHPDRNCAYDEAEACISKSKDDPSRIRSQMAEYASDGFPRSFGLSQNGVIFRDHRNPGLHRLMAAWWEELLKKSKRDQLSLPYASWRSGVKVGIVPDEYGLARKRIGKDQHFYYFRHRSGFRETLAMHLKFRHRLIQAVLRGDIGIQSFIASISFRGSARDRV
jgi:hypothetical protein